MLWYDYESKQRSFHFPTLSNDLRNGEVVFFQVRTEFLYEYLYELRASMRYVGLTSPNATKAFCQMLSVITCYPVWTIITFYYTHREDTAELTLGVSKTAVKCALSESKYLSNQT